MRFQGDSAMSAVSRLPEFSSVFLRGALGGSFLSAVADRFGIWGPYGRPNVAWGSYPRFVAYTAKLLWFMPSTTVPALALGVTVQKLFSVCCWSLVGRLGLRLC